MQFQKTQLPGVIEVDPELHRDERGFFARTFCRREFEDQSLNPNLVQCSVSFNRKEGTLRGVHYQAAPCREAKLVRCTRGAIYDVVLDLRPKSTGFKKWIGIELNAENRKMLYVPEGCAHGFLTLQDNTEIFYQMSEYFHPELSRGIRWNDPAFQITWPAEVKVISDRDRTYPDFESVECTC
jgi:dTDP-4-dehydrorhamnose 3,5-epimerase